MSDMSVERQKGVTGSQSNIQLDPFASKQGHDLPVY